MKSYSDLPFLNVGTEVDITIAEFARLCRSVRTQVEISAAAAGHAKEGMTLHGEGDPG